MTDEPEQVEEIEVPPLTAPVFPWELLLRNSATFFQRTIGGGMQLKFCPVVIGPDGGHPLPPGVVIEFGAEGWERFKAEVAADGDKPRIATVRHFPGGPLSGGVG